MLGGSGLLRRSSLELNRREAPPTWRAFLGSVAATLVVAILGLVCGTAAPALADGSPTITTTNLPAADAGTFYTATLHATGGTGSYSWSVNPSSLPAGLSLDPSSGTISGTPSTATPSSNFTFTVTDGASQVDTQDLSVAVAAALTITTASPLPVGQQGVA